MSELSAYPKISIVTPSYNQAQFLEATLRSVLDQGYPNLEYIVIDGGSTDGSADIIRRYAGHLAYWVSEKDRGQNHAITKGFEHATGDIFAYLNSDDVYCPWAFQTVARIFSELPQVQWLTSQTHMELNEAGALVVASHASQHARSWFYRGQTLGKSGRNKGWIQQETTFWRRELWLAAGARMDESLYMAGDYELWARFYRHADLVTTLAPLAAWRRHGTNKTVHDKYQQVAAGILAPYRRQTVQNPAAVRLLEALFALTGRGAGRFGSRVAWVKNDIRSDRWHYYTRHVI